MAPCASICMAYYITNYITVYMYGDVYVYMYVYFHVICMCMRVYARTYEIRELCVSMCVYICVRFQRGAGAMHRAAPRVESSIQSFGVWVLLENAGGRVDPRQQEITEPGCSL